MNLEEIKKAKQEMELKIYDAIKEFESKTNLMPHKIDLDLAYLISGGKELHYVRSWVEV